jgi:hypothetical protein
MTVVGDEEEAEKIAQKTSLRDAGANIYVCMVTLTGCLTV